MNSIRKIAATDYFAISVDQQDDWIMRPALGQRQSQGVGISPNGTAWFFNADIGFVFYDTARRRLVDRLRTPVASDNGKDTAADLRCILLSNDNGTLVYLLLFHGAHSTDLHVVDVERGEIIRSVMDLPSGVSLCQPALDREGRILVSAILREDGYTAAVLRIDPQTGRHETSTSGGSRATTWFRCSSPCGRYWLRPDDSRIPMVEETSLASRLFGKGIAPPKQYFGFAVEIWEAFPLRRLHSIVPMWMTPDELPDNGYIDHEQRQQGLPPRRGELYRKIAELLQRNTTLTTGRIDKDSHPELWPDRNSFDTNIGSNLRELAFRGDDVIGWQPDSQAFWIQRQRSVVCVGVDGTVSPRIVLERFGPQSGGWRPGAPHWQDATPLPNRRLDLRFKDGMVTVSGVPADPAHRVRIVPRSEDQFRPIQQASGQASGQTNADAALAKKAEALAKRYSVYSIDLASMDETDCVAAIDALTAQIGPDINERPFDKHLQAIFRLDGKRINEKTFFTHVAEHHPGAAPAVRQLIEATCAHMSPHIEAGYDPYGDDIPTGVFGYAAWCLACLDPSSNDVLARYGDLIDTDHEHFYFEKTAPLMLKNAENANDRLQLAERFYFGRLGNCFDYSTFWRFAEMAETAAATMTPEQYAARLLALAGKTSMTRSPSDLGYHCFDHLARDLAKDASPWETALLQDIRRAVSH